MGVLKIQTRRRHTWLRPFGRSRFSGSDTLTVVDSESDLQVHRGVREAHSDDWVRLDEQPAQEEPARSSGAIPRYRHLAFGLAATDLLSAAAALLLAGAIRFEGGMVPGVYLVALGIALFIWVPVFRLYGLYSVRHLSAAEEFRRVIGASSIGVLFIVLTSYWSQASLARQWVALTWGLVLVFELLSRRVWRHVVWKLRQDGRLALKTLIIGTNSEAGHLAVALSAPGLGFEPLGYVTVGDGAVTANGLDVMGDVTRLRHLIRQQAADCVFVASSAVSSQDMLTVVQASRQAGAEVRVSANLPHLLADRLSVQPLGPEVMAISLKPVHLTGGQRVTKRVFDFAIASLGLLVLSPGLALIGLAIKLGSKGPVFFRQSRVTKGGREFTVFKFRTMRADGDEILAERGIDTSAAFFKLQEDPRLTRLGRLLRKSSLDELPQLINVVRGEMSLVGPRPLPVDQVAANLELLGPRHEVPAGVTGWWQINGRSEVSPEESVRLDLFYIDNWSLTLDLYVLLKTVGTILARRGAY